MSSRWLIAFVPSTTSSGSSSVLTHPPRKTWLEWTRDQALAPRRVPWRGPCPDGDRSDRGRAGPGQPPEDLRLRARWRDTDLALHLRFRDRGRPDRGGSPRRARRPGDGEAVPDTHSRLIETGPIGASRRWHADQESWPGCLAVLRVIVSGRSGGGESRQPGLGYLHVLAVVAAANADPADHRVPHLDRIPTAEHDQPVNPGGRAHGKRRIVLDEVMPRVGGHAEADC